MRIYNSKTHTKEEFRPIAPPRVTMYVCGPTVYDEIHIGNARTFLCFDMIRRYLLYKGFDVVFAQNITDVDDKIIARAAERGVLASEIAHEYSELFVERMRAFGILDPTIRPYATQEIDAMCEMISALIERGHAYAVPSGDVYFSVRSIAEYGEISGRNVDDLLAGARVEQNEDKRDALDFALWKAAKPGEPAWSAPWGEGRPGWHTECAAMVQKYLGCPIDIHGGGSDLIFPHHENENAQAHGAFGAEIAQVWMHSGMLRVDGEKMSKSLDNFYTLAEVLQKASPEALRLLMLQTHYRSPLDFSFERLQGSQSALSRIQNVLSKIEWASEGREFGAENAQLREQVGRATDMFQEAMDDDFNSALALSVIFNLVSEANVELEKSSPDIEALQELSDVLQRLLGVFGIVLGSCETSSKDVLIEVAKTLGLGEFESASAAESALVETRIAARAQKDWARADAIRDSIQKAGFICEDSEGTMRIVKRDE